MPKEKDMAIDVDALPVEEAAEELPVEKTVETTVRETISVNKFKGKLNVAQFQREVDALGLGAVVTVEYDANREPSKVTLVAPLGVDLKLLASLPGQHAPAKTDFEEAVTATTEDRLTALEAAVFKKRGTI